MAKLFKLALESSDLEGAVAAEPAQPALDESELEQNVEETTAQQAEIEQGEEEIDQALEEADGLVEQIEANDEKLENPDAVVTAADVEVSEEALKRACYSLGIPYQAKLSFAQESVANDIRSNARKYLQTSNEALMETLQKIIEAAKKLIRSVIQKIQIFANKLRLKFGNYYELVKTSMEKLEANKDMFLVPSDSTINALDAALRNQNSAWARYFLINNGAPDENFFNPIAGIKSVHVLVKSAAESVKKVGDSGKAGLMIPFKADMFMEIDLLLYGYKAKRSYLDEKMYKANKAVIGDLFPVSRPTDSKVLVFNNNGAQFETAKLEELDISGKHIVNSGVTKLFKTFAGGNAVSEAKKWHAGVKRKVDDMLNEVKQIQKDADAELDKIKSVSSGGIRGGFSADAANALITAIRGSSTKATMFYITLLFYDIRTEANILKLMASLTDNKELSENKTDK